MEDGLGVNSWKKSRLENVTWNEQHSREPIEFWYRDIIECAKWLLRQPAYAEHLSYTPQQRFEFDEQGRRVYSKMHTADWWWERQVRISSAGLQRHAWSCLRCADSDMADHTRRLGYRDTNNLHGRRQASYEFLQRYESVASIHDDREPNRLRSHGTRYAPCAVSRSASDPHQDA